MTDEQELNHSESEDALAFEEAWQNWQLKKEIIDHVILESQLRTICALWFNKGNARGCQWGAELVERLLTSYD